MLNCYLKFHLFFIFHILECVKKKLFLFTVFKIKAEYTIHFNTVEKEKQKDKTDIPDGPVVERKCKRCNNDTMSYATLQLRSADEGQTIFFTCTKCQ